MAELTDEEILDIACGESDEIPKLAMKTKGGIISMFEEDAEVSSDIIDFARKLIAADRAKRSDASEAEVALLKYLADCFIHQKGELIYQLDPFDESPVFKAALPDLLKRKNNV